MKKIIYVDKKEGIHEEITLDEAIEVIKTRGKSEDDTFWLDFEEPTQEEIDRVAEAAKIHELTARELLNRKVREKWSEFEGYMYVVGHGLNFNEGMRVLDTVKISMLIYPNFLLSFHLYHVKSVDCVVERLQRETLGKLPNQDWVLYAILDALTDLYLEKVEDFGDEVDKISQEVFVDVGSKALLERIATARRHLVLLRRRLQPKREFLQLLSLRDHAYISRATQVYIRDVLDHVIRMIEMTDVIRETISDAQANYIAQVSNKMNAVMKTLSIVATIMLPLTLVAGLFGMNVHVPGQDAHGELWFWGLIVGMVLMAGGLIYYFKYRDWL